MTENKPVAWLWYEDVSPNLTRDWQLRAGVEAPGDSDWVDQIQPLYTASTLSPASISTGPLAWTYEYHNGNEWRRLLVKFDPSIRDPNDPIPIRNVQAWFPYGVPLCERPPVTQPVSTDAKPVAWAYEYRYLTGWRCAVTRVDPASFGAHADVRNVEMLYRHPPAPQPDTDPAVEAARRKALRAIFAALDEVTGYSDLYAVRLAVGILRDLVGHRPEDTRVSIGSYDEPAPPLTVEHLNEFARAALKTYAEAPPARLSVDGLTDIISAAAGGRPLFGNIITYNRIAKAIHGAVYGKGE